MEGWIVRRPPEGILPALATATHRDLGRKGSAPGSPARPPGPEILVLRPSGASGGRLRPGILPIPEGRRPAALASRLTRAPHSPGIAPWPFLETAGQTTRAQKALIIQCKVMSGRPPLPYG